MSVHVTSEAITRSQSSGVARLVLLCMCDKAGDEGVAWPSRETMMQWANASESAVKSGLRWLRESGEIEVISQGGGRAKSTRYKVNIGLKKPSATPGKGGTFCPVSEQNGHILPGNDEASKGSVSDLFNVERGQILPLKGSDSDPDPSVTHQLGGGGGARTSATADFQIFVDAIGRPDFAVSADDQRESEFWTNKLELSQSDQLAVVARVMAGKLDAPPNSFKFFTPAMKREAAV